MNNPLLIDTCALIWIMNKSKINLETHKVIHRSASGKAVFLNPMSAWEIGMLVTKNRISLSMPVDTWFEKALAFKGFQLSNLTVSTLIHSTNLPGSPPNDPVDRMMAALARIENMTLVTRDKQLLEYGAKGYLRVLRC